MTWQLFTIISIIGLSVSVLLQRTLLHKYKIDAYAYVIASQAVVGVILFIPALARGFSLTGIKDYLPLAILSIICFGAGNILYAKTLQQVEASRFAVIFASQAVWTMLLGVVLLRESMTYLQVAGTLLLLSSIVLLVKDLRKTFTDRGMVYGLLTGLLFGIAVYFWSYVGRYVDGVSWAAISFIATSAIVLLLRPSTVTRLRPILHPAIFSRLTLLSIFYGIGSLAMLFAYQLGTFTVISPLRQTGIIVTVLLALIFLPAERTSIHKKLLAALVCTIGVLLITT